VVGCGVGGEVCMCLFRGMYVSFHNSALIKGQSMKCFLAVEAFLGWKSRIKFVLFCMNI
jgi:hypothetical protein